MKDSFWFSVPFRGLAISQGSFARRAGGNRRKKQRDRDKERESSRERYGERGRRGETVCVCKREK